MQPEIDMAYTSPRVPLSSAATGAQLRLSLEAGPMCLIPRRLDPTIADALDRLDPTALPSLDVSGAIDRVRQAVEAAMTQDDAPVFPVQTWLCRDILDLAALFVTTTGAETLRVNLQVVSDDMCRKFHVDNVAFRLLTTYRGPGTEWMPPRVIADAAMGEPLSLEEIRRLERGTIAVMRGGKNATSERPGVIHRSPPIAGQKTIRLLLAIDEAGGTLR